MEIEKGLAGVGGGQSNDGGTTKRAMAQVLKFLSDRPDGIYFAVTCNDISALPPEWIRAERWDGTFFIDLPNDVEKQEILSYYKKEFGVKGKIDMKGFTGAEIKTACRLAAMIGTTLENVRSMVKPISEVMGDQINSLRKWALTRTIPASEAIVATGRNIEI